MSTQVSLYSVKSGEITRFLENFYQQKLENSPIMLKWDKKFENPIEMAEIIGVFIDNHEDYSINMWVSLDENAFINITSDNADSVIRYLYERFPY